jgi:hypothetical protein
VALAICKNDSTTEHLTSSTFAGFSATLGTEEAFSAVANANASYLIGDSSVPSGSQNFIGNYTDGNHHPGAIVAGYNGVGSISVVAQGHGDTGGTPAGPITLTGSGLNSGDLLVAMFCFFAGPSITMTDTSGTTFLTQAATTFRYIGSEITASGSSATISGTPSARVSWIGFMLRLQPLSAGTLKTVNGLATASIKTIQSLALASVKK